MKKLILKFGAILAMLFLQNQCTNSRWSVVTPNKYMPSISSAESEAIRKEIPNHQGKIYTGKLGDYQYEASNNMVEFGAPGDSGIYLISPVYVFDLSRMTHGLDTLIIGDKDGLYRCSTLIKGEKVTESSISPELETIWFARANEVLQIVEKQKADERARRSREEARKIKEDARKWRSFQEEGEYFQQKQPSNKWNRTYLGPATRWDS